MHGFMYVCYKNSHNVASNKLMMIKTYLIVVLSLVLVQNALGELTKFSWSNHTVRGVYKNEDATLGIKFASSPSALHVKTLDGTTIVKLKSVNEIHTRMTRSVRILNSEYAQDQYDTWTHTKPLNETIKELVQIKEVHLLENASHAIGDLGVTGRNMPAVLPFVMFALRISVLLQTPTEFSTVGHTKRQLINRISTQLVANRNGPDTQVWPKIANLLWNQPSTKKPKWDDECRGLCGRKCTCWWVVCRTCERRIGCLTHDLCCDKEGFDSPKCLFPFLYGFSCDKPYDC